MNIIGLSGSVGEGACLSRTVPQGCMSSSPTNGWKSKWIKKTAMLVINSSAGVAPEVNLRIVQATKYTFWNPV